MTTPSIADLLKYADLQMAAEAFLTVLPIDGSALKSGQALSDALIFGNGHASKFTETQAKNFLAHWTVVAQQTNTGTGFSGTLFVCKVDDPATGAKAGERSAAPVCACIAHSCVAAEVSSGRFAECARLSAVGRNTSIVSD